MTKIVFVLGLLLVLAALVLGLVLLPVLLPLALVGTVLDRDGQPILQVLTPDAAAVEVALGPEVASAPGPVGAGRPSQFALGLSAGDALAACGPAAAIGFARALGRNPSVADVMAIARRGWWDSAVGMHGATAEQGMLRDLGLLSVLEPINWSHVVAEAAAHRPVILDTPGHYYFADAYDAGTGRLHVGTSGTDLRGGAAWMTPEQIDGMPVSKGSVRAALYEPESQLAGAPS